MKIRKHHPVIPSKFYFLGILTDYHPDSIIGLKNYLNNYTSCLPKGFDEYLNTYSFRFLKVADEMSNLILSINFPTRQSV
jgi:hypothetical protein